jgi:hypothetical protein
MMHEWHHTDEACLSKVLIKGTERWFDLCNEVSNTSAFFLGEFLSIIVEAKLRLG